jgi:hypothetical protein
MALARMFSLAKRLLVESEESQKLNPFSTGGMRLSY